MPDYTSRLKLIKPADGEPVEVSQLNANSDALDASPGTFICTSTTRPANPFAGQHIYETDTKTELVYDGSKWLTLSTAAASRRVFTASNVNGEVTEGTGGFRVTVTEIVPDTFLIKGRVRYTGNLNPVPATLRWFYLPSSCTPTGTTAFAQITGTVLETQRSVPFRINSSNYETDNRRNAVEMIADIPASVNGLISFDSVYVI